MENVTSTQRQRRYNIIKVFTSILLVNNLFVLFLAITGSNNLKDFTTYSTATASLLITGISVWIGGIFKKNVRD